MIDFDTYPGTPVARRDDAPQILSLKVRCKTYASAKFFEIPTINGTSI